MKNTDKSVRDLPVTARLKDGQIIVEQSASGIVFSFPVAVWPSDRKMQWEWIIRLTPWWDVIRIDWTPQAHRLREACLKSINDLAAFQREPKGAHSPKVVPGADGVERTGNDPLRRKHPQKVKICIPEQTTK